MHPSRCLFLVLTSIVSAAEIRTDKTSYLVREPVIVTFSGLPGNPNDWITVVPASLPDDQYRQYFNSQSRVSGTMNFDPPGDPTTYEARLYFKGEYVVRARTRFTVSWPATTVATDKTAYLVLERIRVTFTNMPGWNNDYVTLVRRASPDNVYGVYQLTNGAINGVMTFDSLEPGDWEARVKYRNEDNGLVRARAFFSVSYPIPTVNTSKEVYQVLEPISVTYSNMPGYDNDYITLVGRGSPDNIYGAYQLTRGARSGTMTFEPLEPGDWEARVKFRNEDNGPVRARKYFSVVYPVPTLTMSKPNYATNERITVSYANMPGYPQDYITVVPANLPDNEYRAYQLTNGQRSGTMTFDPLPAGTYEARAKFRNEDSGPVRARVRFTVGGNAPPSSVELSRRSIDFGRVALGQSADQTLTVRNTGAAPLTLDSTLPPNSVFRIVSPPLPVTLAAGASATFTLRFTPSAASAYTGTLTVGGESVALAGTGESAAGPITVTVTPSTVVQNGTVTVTWSGGRSGRARDYVGLFRAGEAVNSGNLLRPTWAYTDGLTAGSRQLAIPWGPGQYVFFYLFDDGYEIGGTSAPLTVTAAGATFGLNPSILDFGAVLVGQSRELSLTLTNNTATAQSVSAVTFSNSVFRLISPATPFSVAGNASQLLWVRFTPVIPGTQSGTVELQNLSASLTGRGETSSGGGSGGNLVTGGGGEDPGRITNCQVLGERFGWLGIGGFSICPYGTWVPADAPGPPDRGLNHFWGGASNAISSATQSIDLTRVSSAIDAGTQPFTLSGWLGGLEGQDDNITVRVSFFSITGGMVGDSVTIGPVLATERRSITGMVFKSASGTIPAGARRADVVIIANRVVGPDNDSVADNVSFTLTAGGGTTSAEVSPNRLDFGNVLVNQTSNLTLTLRNTGTTSQQVTEVRSSNPRFTLVSPALPFTLPAGATQVMTIRFAPTATGEQTGSLAVLGLNVGLTGTGIVTGGGGSLEATPSRLDFGRVTIGQTPELTLTLRNNGTASQLVASAQSTNQLFTLVSPAPPFTVPANGSVTLRVRFVPTAAGEQTGTLIVGSLSIPLSGTGETGGGGGAGCGYFVNPLDARMGGTGGTLLILVTTAPGCAWTATPSSSSTWIEITAGRTGTGSGAVSLRIPANPSTSPRTGTVAIGGGAQLVTFTLLQEGGPACTYSLDKTTENVAGAGGTVTVRVTTQTGCSIAIQPNVSWIRGSASGATVTLTVDANPNAQSRTGTVLIGGVTFTVTQGAAGSVSGPAISPGGVVGGASFTPASLPGGALARGSFFSIFGAGIGPSTPVQATRYPLTTSLGDVVVAFTGGGRRVEAYPYFVMNSQINGIVPSNTPLGDVQVTITYRGQTSPPMTAKVVDTNFGIFSTQAGRGPGIVQNFVAAGQTPLNTRSFAAKPGDTEILWGTGLGPITTPDYEGPPGFAPVVPVEVVVGNRSARVNYAARAPGLAGLDQIVFVLPSDTPPGCNVPVQVKAGGLWSNTVTIAVSADGQPCSDAGNPFERLIAGARGGAILLSRANIFLSEPGKPPQEGTMEFGTAMFQETTATGEIGFNLLTSLPPLGTCTTVAQTTGDDLLGTGTSLLPGKELDAGPEIRITSPSGVTKTLLHSDEEQNKGPYGGALGGGMPGGSKPPDPLFLTGGTYRVSAAGGRDVGAFTVNATLPATPFTWTNRNALNAISRDQGFRVDWAGGSGQNVVVLGMASNNETKATGGFVCFVPGAPGNYTVGPSALSNLPATEVAALVVGAVPGEMPPPFTAPGLDSGRVVLLNISLRTVGVR